MYHPSTCKVETSAILSNRAANPPLGKGRGHTAAHQLPTWTLASLALPTSLGKSKAP